MKTILYTTLLFIIALGSTGCMKKLTPFTQGLYQQNNWSDEDLRRIQFYLSRDIVLQRGLTSGSSEIASGRVRVVDGRQIEEVVIRKGTPGVFLFRPGDSGNNFAVAFEDGDDTRFLMFGPNPKQGNRYNLLAREWKDGRGQITYDSRTYYTTTQSAMATLMVDLRRIRNYEKESRRVRGRKVQ